MKKSSIVSKGCHGWTKVGTLILALVVLPGTANAQPSSLWSPATRPKECETVDAQLILIDVSRSMKKNNLFGRAVAQIANYIDEAPSRTYIILGRFGTTADVIDDGFITTSRVRERLKASLRQLRATHRTTNLDEAAKLIELVQFKLEAAYDNTEFSLSVKVLSDEISSPDPDKHRFSLRDFFQQRLASAHVNVVEVAMTSSGTVPATVRAHERYVVLTTPVSTLRDLLHQTTGNVPRLERTSFPIPAPKNESTGSRRWILVVCGLALIGLLGLIIARSRLQGVAPEPEGNDAEPDLRPAEVPVALIVTEREFPEDGTDGEPKLLREGERIPIAPNAPVTFGTDASQCTLVVLPIKGVEADELFSVTLTRKGLLHLKAMSDALCRNRPVPDKGLMLAPNEPFQLRLGNREWTITSISAADEQTPADNLFARIHANRTAAQAANS